MGSNQRPDDLAKRREPLEDLTDAELHARFWSLAEQVVAPLVQLARTHTSPSIERSVLLRMGFASAESQALVAALCERGWLGRGAGRLVLELARQRGESPREVGLALLAGRHWEALEP
jgi:D-ornithine 4,5-aminomutase subunit alpha